MCGRFFLDLLEAEIEAYFQAQSSPDLGETRGPRYNLGPGQSIWVIRANPCTQARTLDALHWGLVPHFAADRRGAYRAINARAESIERTPSYRTAFAKRRCLVVARGFYEWQKQGKHKQPYAIEPSDGAPLALAGIWENWLDKSTGEWLRSVAIVTKEASDVLRPIHDRMPVIIGPDHFAAWLGEQPTRPEQLKALLDGDPRELRLWPVSPRMNRTEVDDPQILDRVEPNERESGV